VVEIKGYNDGLQMKGPQKKEVEGYRWQAKPPKNMHAWRREGQ
jgi:hypothetical protein